MFNFLELCLISSEENRIQAKKNTSPFSSIPLLDNALAKMIFSAGILNYTMI